MLQLTKKPIAVQVYEGSLKDEHGADEKNPFTPPAAIIGIQQNPAFDGATVGVGVGVETDGCVAVGTAVKEGFGGRVCAGVGVLTLLPMASQPPGRLTFRPAS